MQASQAYFSPSMSILAKRSRFQALFGVFVLLVWVASSGTTSLRAVTVESRWLEDVGRGIGQRCGRLFGDYEDSEMWPEADQVCTQSSGSETRSLKGIYNRIEAAEGHCPHVVGEVGDCEKERENAGKSLAKGGGKKKVENPPCAVVERIAVSCEGAGGV